MTLLIGPQGLSSLHPGEDDQTFKVLHSLARNTTFYQPNYISIILGLTAINFLDEMQEREACKCQIKCILFFFM